MDFRQTSAKVIEFPSKPPDVRCRDLERLYADHGAALRSFLGVRMGVGGDVEDVVQDVFTKLAQMEDLRERLPASDRSVRAYIFQMANNHLLNLYRHKAVRKRHAEQERKEMDEMAECGPERIVLAQRELDVIRETIQRLPLPCRQAFILNRFKQKTYVEVARHMGVTIKQVEKYMEKALIAVRRTVKRLRESER